MRVKMLTWGWNIGDKGGGELRAAEDGEINIMYMNVGGSVDATHEFLEHCARGGVAVSSVYECWMEKNS